MIVSERKRQALNRLKNALMEKAIAKQKLDARLLEKNRGGIMAARRRYKSAVHECIRSELTVDKLDA